MGLWDKIRSGVSAVASAAGSVINYSRSNSPPPPNTDSRRGDKRRVSHPKKEEKNPDDETLRLMETADDRDLAKNIVSNVYSHPFLVRAGTYGRSAIKYAAAVLVGGSIMKGDLNKTSIVEGSGVSVEARVRNVEAIGNKVIAYAAHVKDTKQPEAIRTVAGLLVTIREAKHDGRYSSVLGNLETKLEKCEENLGRECIAPNERTPYSKDQLAETNNAYNMVTNFIWFGKNETKKVDQAKQALATYKQLRSNSVAAFNDPVNTRFELETLEDLMKLKEKALAANKDIETGLYTRSVESEDIRKYAVIAQTLRKHATAMNAEIIKLEKLGNKITGDQENRKKKVRAVRESIDRTMKDIGTTIYHSVENLKTTTSVQSQECDTEYGSKRIVYEKATPFTVKDFVLSPYDQVGKTQWSELTKKNMTVRAYAELANGVNERTKVRTKAVELTQKEILRAYDMARTITDGIHATAGIEARNTNVNDVLNHILEKMLCQKLTKSQGYWNEIHAFTAYAKAREAEKVWRSTPIYNIFRMGKRDAAKRTAEAEYAKANVFAPEIRLYQRAAERVGVNRRAA